MDERRVYFVNAGVDFLLIGGLSLFGAMGAVALDYSGAALDLAPAAFALMWVVNWPHFAATSWRLYRSRESMAQYPATAFGAPLLVAGLAASAFLWPREAAPAFVKLFTLWSPFHFSGQTLGLTLLYARRAGMRVGRLDRAAFAGFIFASYVWLILVQETELAPGSFGKVQFARFGLPEWMSLAALVALHVLGLLMLLVYAKACLGARRLVAPIVLLPAVAQYVWFIVGWRLPDFNLFVPLFHSLQYLLIAGAVQLKERGPASSPWRGTAAWGVLNVLLGAALFWLLPRSVALAGIPLGLSVPVLSAAVQVHHFFVDGVIWKLRNPKVDVLLRGAA